MELKLDNAYTITNDVVLRRCKFPKRSDQGPAPRRVPPTLLFLSQVGVIALRIISTNPTYTPDNRTSHYIPICWHLDLRGNHVANVPRRLDDSTTIHSSLLLPVWSELASPRSFHRGSLLNVKLPDPTRGIGVQSFPHNRQKILRYSVAVLVPEEERFPSGFARTRFFPQSALGILQRALAVRHRLHVPLVDGVDDTFPGLARFPRVLL
jgi:hypothetical protein